MTIEEFANIDNTFNSASFISKCNNIFIKYFTAIMMDNLKEVDHFISDDVYAYGEYILKNLRSQNYRQMYDELNVKSTNLQNIEIINNQYVITVYLESRYLDYIINLQNGNIVEGDNTSRKQVNYRLIFTKNIDTSNQGIVKKCDACGSPMNVNNSGICEYCGSIYKQEKYDWVLTQIHKIKEQHS